MGLVACVALLFAACGPGTSTDGPTSPPTDPPTTTSPATTSTTTPAATCDSADGTTLVVDLDRDGTDESVTLTLDPSVGSSSLTLCTVDGVSSVLALPSGDATLVGAIDLDNDALTEILFSFPTDDGIQLGAAAVTLRGLTATSVEVLRWIDLADIDQPGPFTGTSFQCTDWDDDGNQDLIRFDFRPAEGEENVSVSLVTLDGLEAARGGLDQYETTYEDAVALWAKPDRCAPDAPLDLEVSFTDQGWALVPLDPGVFAGAEDLVLTAIAESNGRLAVVGLEAPNPLVGELSAPVPLAWWSDDALTWSQATVEGTNGEIIDVISLADGGFAAGGRVGGDAAVWTSQDGSEWALSTLSAGAADGQGVVYSIVEIPGTGLVALGAETYFPEVVGPREDSDAAAWVSADGRAWERVEAEPFGTPGYQPNDDGQFNAAILDGTWLPGVGLVAIGYKSESDPVIDYPLQRPALFVSEDGLEWDRYEPGVEAALSGISTVGDQVFLFGNSALQGSPTANGVILVSDDARNWQVAEGPFGDDSGLQLVNAVLGHPSGGWAALGSDQVDFEVRGAAAVWFADESGEWSREDHDDTIFGTITESPVMAATGGVITDDATLVAIGTSGESSDLIGGGSVCCLYRPLIWVYDPSRETDN